MKIGILMVALGFLFLFLGMLFFFDAGLLTIGNALLLAGKFALLLTGADATRMLLCSQSCTVAIEHVMATYSFILRFCPLLSECRVPFRHWLAKDSSFLQSYQAEREGSRHPMLLWWHRPRLLLPVVVYRHVD